LSVYTREKAPNLSQTLFTLPITVCNFSAALGRVLVGFASDHLGPTNTFIIAITVSGLLQAVMWNFAYSYATIMAFSMLYGFWGGCFVSLLAPVAAQLFGHKQLANVSGLLALTYMPGELSLASIGMSAVSY
jgi:nitrate/nitrite transporter NarK